LFVALLPANIHAATADVAFANGEAATPLWQRIPEQVLYLAVVLWVARTADNRPTRRLLRLETGKAVNTRREKENVHS
jgi:hypothetical protein